MFLIKNEINSTSESHLFFALNSFRQTALILSVAILSVGLSFLGLFVGQQNYGFIGTISAVGLIGLSINDSIIVLSHIKEEAEKKEKRISCHCSRIFYC